MTTPHPPGCYYANPVVISVQRQCNPLLVLALAPLGYFGRDDLPANPHNAFSDFNTALAWAKLGHQGTQPGGPPGPGNPSVGNPLTGVNAIGDFFQRLTQSSTWIRVGEFVAGGILLWVGLNALAKNTAAGEAARTIRSGAKKTAKVASKVAK